ncbi:MAG TPA: ABC transporter ATP-binding protein [Ktedonobacterales bacterium]|nr:ABC transporter ATP-binding protein [Ktedonobacterales bacterium]
MQNKTIISIQDLRVSYKDVQAVDGISLDIYEGECFGLLGPNGAGKTTTLSCLEGLKKPDSGSITVENLDALKESKKVKRMLGVQLQDTTLFPDLTTVELVELYASFYEVFLTRKQILEHLARFDLQEKARAKAKELSGGQRQRLGLALAVAHDPRIAVLDEPTTGLDPQARRGIWDSIRQMQREGRTVILTTHYMEEAEVLCKRIGIIDHGKILALDTPHALTRTLGEASTLSVDIELDDEHLEKINTLAGVTTVSYVGGRLDIQTTQPPQTLADLQLIAVSAGRSLRDITIRQPNLEDVFLSLTGRKIRD